MQVSVSREAAKFLDRCVQYDYLLQRAKPWKRAKRKTRGQIIASIAEVHEAKLLSRVRADLGFDPENPVDHGPLEEPEHYRRVYEVDKPGGP